VVWYGEMMFAVFGGCQSEVASSLASDAVTEEGKSSCELVTGDIARELHTVKTSSRTWWSRSTLGVFPSSK
jgi:hypothetical protein